MLSRSCKEERYDPAPDSPQSGTCHSSSLTSSIAKSLSRNIELSKASTHSQKPGTQEVRSGGSDFQMRARQQSEAREHVPGGERKTVAVDVSSFEEGLTRLT